MNMAIVRNIANASFCRRVVFNVIAAMVIKGKSANLTTGFKYGCHLINSAAGGLNL